MNKHDKIFHKDKIIFHLNKDKFPDPRHYKTEIVGDSLNFPKEIDLRNNMSPIKNQGYLGSCQSFALMSMFEHFLNKNKKQDTPWDLSEMYEYYEVREFRKQQDLNVGAYIIDTVKVPFRDGFTTENYWPYIISKFTTKPGFMAFLSARFYPLYGPKAYYSVPMDLDSIKDQLVQGNPIIFGIQVRQNFINYKSGVFGGMSGTLMGGHAMTICGYSDSKNALLIRNSWGTSWGEEGYGWIDYTLVKDMFDLFIVK